MVALLPHSSSSSPDRQNESRTQHSENHQENANASVINRTRPRGKIVPSRYLSSSSPSSSSSSSSYTSSAPSVSVCSSLTPSTTKRLCSPLVPRSQNSSSDALFSSPRTRPSSFPQRSKSAGRIRHSLLDPAHPSDFSAATKMLITSSRSLSVSFQGKAFSLPISKKKEMASPTSGLKTAPELNKSVQKPRTNENQWNNDGGGGGILEPLSTSLNSFGFGYEMAGSDDDHESDDISGVSKVDSLRRDFIASTKFWQETNSRLRRLHDPGLTSLNSSAVKINSSAKSTQLRKAAGDGPKFSTPTKLSTSSPSSPSKTVPDPCCNRHGANGHGNHYHGSLPSILSFSADIRRGKVGEDLAVKAHTLRLLHNHYLQWRLGNARADAAIMVQSEKAGQYLWNAWISISELRHSVVLRRIKLQLLRQKLKLTSIIRGQIPYLEEWGSIDKDHSDSLYEATKALQASTVRLPVVGKAEVDIQTLKDAICSAVDVMQAMLSTVILLTPKVEATSSVTAELINITRREKDLLEECNGFLLSLAAMQVTDSSLKTQVVQLTGESTKR